MLQYLDTIYLKVATIDRRNDSMHFNYPPTVFLDIWDRRELSPTLIGQIRFNLDPTYSKKPSEIRMSFNVFNIDLIDPIKNPKLLEDIIVGGFLWITLDNHYTYDFHPNPYMVIHSYKEDNIKMESINSKVMSILSSLKCEKRENNIYVFSKNTTSQYLSEKLSSVKD